MKPSLSFIRLPAFLTGASMAIGCATETLPPVPLRATGGPVVALWRKETNPNKPYIAQLFAPGEKTRAIIG